MDSMTSAKAQWLQGQMSTVQDCFMCLVRKFHDPNTQEAEIKKFNSLYESINGILDSYQRCKVGTLCRKFEQLSAHFSYVYSCSNVDQAAKFKIRHQIIPVFSIIDQDIDLTS